MTKYNHIKIFGLRLKWWVYRGEYSLSKNGKWPVAFFLTSRGIGFHGGEIADAHIEFEERIIW